MLVQSLHQHCRGVVANGWCVHLREQFLGVRGQVVRTHLRARSFREKGASDGERRPCPARCGQASLHSQVFLTGEPCVGKSFDEYCDGRHLDSVKCQGDRGPVDRSRDVA